MKLGYIGLGSMGGALARRLMREHQLRAFDLRPEVLGRFAEAGAVPTQSAQALARESDMIMTCLPTSAEVRDVLFGEGRVAEVLRPLIELYEEERFSEHSIAARELIRQRLSELRA